MRKDYTAELESFRNKTFKMCNEIEQIAAKALGYYPAYRDDPKIFPDVSPDDDSVCIGDHVTETIVAELAEKYKFLKAENNKLTKAMVEIKNLLEDTLEGSSQDDLDNCCNAIWEVLRMHEENERKK